MVNAFCDNLLLHQYKVILLFSYCILPVRISVKCITIVGMLWAALPLKCYQKFYLLHVIVCIIMYALQLYHELLLFRILFNLQRNVLT